MRGVLFATCCLGVLASHAPSSSLKGTPVVKSKGKVKLTSSVQSATDSLVWWCQYYTDDNQCLVSDVNTTAIVVGSINSNIGVSEQRFIVGWPAGNSGSFLEFKSTAGNSNFGITFKNETLETCKQDAFHGIKARISLPEETDITRMVLGGIRTIRDYVESGYNLGNIHKEITYKMEIGDSIDNLLDASPTSPAGSVLQFTRVFYDPTMSVVTTITLPDGVDTTFTTSQTTNPEDGTYNFNIKSPSSVYPVEIIVQSVVNIPSPVVLTPDQLFSNATVAADAAVEPMSFLTNTKYLTAGAWKFMTYFGRDTLITAMLMKDRLANPAMEATLQGALERLDTTGTAYSPEKGYNSTGFVCHEETLGDYAGWQRATNQSGWPVTNPACQPTYDYKMVDTDFLILPIAGDFLTKDGYDFNGFLNRQSSLDSSKSLKQLLNYNIQRVLSAAKPFADNPKKFTNLVKIRHETVGNWRDSNEGLASGLYPFDVNVALVPASLRAIRQLADAGIVDKNTGNTADDYYDTWNRNAMEYFEIRVDDRDDWNDIIQDYATFKSADHVTDMMGDSDNDDAPDHMYALSLTADGNKVDIMNSDVGFAMLLCHDLDDDFLRESARLVKTRFPRGLLTTVGPVVANPAASQLPSLRSWMNPAGGGPTDLVNVLDRKGYHGTVVWGWQVALLARGLDAQIERGPNHDVKEKLEDARQALWDVIEANMAIMSGELWTWDYDTSSHKFNYVDFGSLTGGTESDVEQLWSNAFIGYNRPARSGAFSTMSVGVTAIVATAVAFLFM